MEGESDWSEIELKQAELENINLPSRFSKVMRNFTTARLTTSVFSARFAPTAARKPLAF